MNPLALGVVLVAAAAVGVPLLACIIAYMCRRRARVNYDPLYASAEDDLAQDNSDSDDLESAPDVADGTSTDDLLDFSQPPSGGTVRTEGLTSATWVNEMNAEQLLELRCELAPLALAVPHAVGVRGFPE